MTKRNITPQEQVFNDSRDELIELASKCYIADAPALFSSRIGVQSLITRYELYKLIIDIPGDIIELGVYKGNSFLWLAHLSIILEPYSINRRIIGFDTFSGFSSIDPTFDPSDVSETSFSDTEESLIRRSLTNLNALRPVNKIPRFELVKGDITKTVPEYIKEHDWMTCAMLILDTDLYLPTKIGLEYIVPLMPKGSIIVFDEYNYRNFPGETKAIREAFNLNDIVIKKFSYESCTAYTII